MPGVWRRAIGSWPLANEGRSVIADLGSAHGQLPNVDRSEELNGTGAAEFADAGSLKSNFYAASAAVASGKTGDCDFFDYLLARITCPIGGAL